MISRSWPASLLLLAMALLACAPRASLPERQILVEGVADERERLASERDRDPSSIEGRIALGEAYYRSAREALDLDHDEERYLVFLSLSVHEFVAAVELDPRDDRPHFYLAMMDTYRGEIEKALRGFRNTLTLRPSQSARTNIAEIYVYMDQIEKARHWNGVGGLNGSPTPSVMFNEMLIAWRLGDLEESERIFARLRDRHPETVRTINVARLPHPPSRFDEFARYCCRSPACGPYMVEPCRAVGVTVEDRELSAAAALKELRIEIEKERRLREIYRQHKEIEIEIEGAPTTEP